MITDYKKVTLKSGYLFQKEELDRRVTVKAVYDRFAESGRVEAFACRWREGMPHRPHFFWDSDVAKWMEGAAYLLARGEDPALTDKVESIIDDIEKNQGEDGYFNIYFTVVEPLRRFSNRDCHELYCAGHLIEAAVAYYEATGRDRFLHLMEKYVAYIYRVFVEERSAAFQTPGHEEIELALYRLYRLNRDPKVLSLMQYFLERRGAPDNHEAQIFNEEHYAQSYAPIREQTEAFGHSVRAMYLYAGMADLAAETGDEALLSACRQLFGDVTGRKMYITGGIGSTCIGEAFTAPYDLPNATAYTETCASIGMIYFASRMFKADPTHASRYHDAVELELYNGALSGLSLDGEKFFYENPLEIRRRERNRITSTHERERFPITQRVKVFGCSCCPPNLVRLLASLGEYVYAYDEENGEIYINQFAHSEGVFGGKRIELSTAYPDDGILHVKSEAPFALRIPAWCHDFTADRPYGMANGYAHFEAGEATITLTMEPELLGAHASVTQDQDKAALRRGPVIYCAEGVDHTDPSGEERELHRYLFDGKEVSRAAVTVKGDGSLPTLRLSALYRRETTEGLLYAPLAESFDKTELRMIPYASFANRGETDMQVWFGYRL